MSKVDIDIYVNQIFKFFDSNPNDLRTLIGGLEKDIFYQRVKVAAVENYEKNGEPELTKKQMVDIVAQMFFEANEELNRPKIESVFMSTKFGEICMN